MTSWETRRFKIKSNLCIKVCILTIWFEVIIEAHFPGPSREIFHLEFIRQTVTDLIHSPYSLFKDFYGLLNLHWPRIQICAIPWVAKDIPNTIFVFQAVPFMPVSWVLIDKDRNLPPFLPPLSQKRKKTNKKNQKGVGNGGENEH